MTEEEAKTKLCPMSFNQPKTDHDEYLCLGSACMWWVRETRGPVYPDEIKPDAAYVEGLTGLCEVVGGHCGAVK